MFRVGNAEILSNEKVADGYFTMEILAPVIAKIAKPGQFLNIKVADGLEPLLRRPISIYDADAESGKLKILYFKKGRGTEILSQQKKGSTLDITGPHGNTFPIQKDFKNILLVGGGFGTAPLSFLAKENTDKNIFVAIGARTKEFVFCVKDFEKIGAKVEINTEDGSLGEKGLVTLSVQKVIDENKIDAVYVVGPVPMMKAVAKIVEEKNIPCFVSMEERMACGVGTCFGCVCKTKKGYETVCSDGPVFDSRELEW